MKQGYHVPTMGDYITRGLVAAQRDASVNQVIERQAGLTATERAMREVAHLQKQAEAKERARQDEQVAADRASALLMDWQPASTEAMPEGLTATQEAMWKARQIERTRLSKATRAEANTSHARPVTSVRRTDQGLITRAATRRTRSAFHFFCDVCGHGPTFTVNGQNLCAVHVTW